MKVKPMKLAVTGKGGVGKTFIAGTLARILAKDGYKVLAVDADPNTNLAYTLGFREDEILRITPLAVNRELIYERTSIPGLPPGTFKLFPKVDDIVDRFGVRGPDGVMLLVMGTVRDGGTGCLCPAHAFLRSLLRHLIVERSEFIILDMEAGIEHLGRGTAKNVDVMLIVVEPSFKSIETAQRIKKLASDIGIRYFAAVGNKVSTKEEEEFIKDELEKYDIPLLVTVPFDKQIAYADLIKVSPIDHAPLSPAVKAVSQLKKSIIKYIKNITFEQG